MRLGGRGRKEKYEEKRVLKMIASLKKETLIGFTSLLLLPFPPIKRCFAIYLSPTNLSLKEKILS